MTYDTILYEVEDRTATITFNRPDQLNAVNPPMGTRAARRVRRGRGRRRRVDDRRHRERSGVLRRRRRRRGPRRRPGAATTAATSRTSPSGRRPRRRTPPFRLDGQADHRRRSTGICCGAGLDLVTTGDIAIASDRAEFFDPHVSIGLVSGREMVRLARVLPLNVAMRMALMGRHERMSAQRAYDARSDLRGGRARRAASTGSVRSRRMVNRNAPLAVRGTRLAIRKGLGLPLTRPRSWPRRSASGSCAPTTPRRARARSSRSATPSGRAE